MRVRTCTVVQRYRVCQYLRGAFWLYEPQSVPDSYALCMVLWYYIHVDTATERLGQSEPDHSEYAYFNAILSLKNILYNYVGVTSGVNHTT